MSRKGGESGERRRTKSDKSREKRDRGGKYTGRHVREYTEKKQK